MASDINRVLGSHMPEDIEKAGTYSRLFIVDREYFNHCFSLKQISSQPKLNLCKISMKIKIIMLNSFEEICTCFRA